MAEGVRWRCSCSLWALWLRVKVELAEEELRSSLKLLLSLKKLSSLSAIGLLPRCSSSPSASTVIMGGGMCFEAAGVVGTALAGNLAVGWVGGCSVRVLKERDLSLLPAWSWYGDGDLAGGRWSRFPCERLNWRDCCSGLGEVARRF